MVTVEEVVSLWEKSKKIKISDESERFWTKLLEYMAVSREPSTPVLKKSSRLRENFEPNRRIKSTKR